MKKGAVIILILVCLVPSEKAGAQLTIAQVIAEGVKKVIRAVDLKIQRLQNRTVWLQNAQKTLENEMSKSKLLEISGWVEAHRTLYQDYFRELEQVKTVLATYASVKTVIEQQAVLVREYKSAWNVFRRDKTFSPEELEAMLRVYEGMMKESLRNVDQLALVINSFQTRMSDGERIQIVNAVSRASHQTLIDLKRFNEGARLLSLQRGAESGELEYLKKLYGL